MKTKTNKYLFLCQNRKGTGTYWRAFELAKEIAKFGHHVTLVCTRNTPGVCIQADWEKGVKIVATPSGNMFGTQSLNGYSPIELIFRLFYLLRKKFDIVYAFENRPSVLLPALLMKAKGATYYTDWCDVFGKGGFVEDKSIWLKWWLRPIESFFDTKCRKLASKITVINQFLYEKARALGFLSENILLLRNGIEVFENIPNPKVSKEALGFNDEQLLVGYLGGITKADQNLLSNSLNLLFTNNPTIQFLHVGNKNIDILKNVINKKNCHETGNLSKKDIMFSALNACDVLWLLFAPNEINNNRWPSKISEYLAINKPIIAVCNSELTTFLSSFSSVFFANNSPESLVCETEKALSQKQKKHELPDEYSWTSLAQKLDIFLELP